MQNIKLLPLARSISSFAPKTKPATLSALPMFLESYHENNARANVYSHNQTIHRLIKFGSFQSALQLFDEMPQRDVVSWNMLISGFGRNGFPIQALGFYYDMVHQDIEESSSTFSTVLSICCDMGFHRQGVQVHCRVVVFGLSSNLFVASSLVSLYMNMGLYHAALKMFHDLLERNLAIWNVVLRGFCEVGMSVELLRLFTEMKLEGVLPNAVSFCYLMRGCGDGRLLDEGKQLHCEMLKMGWIECDIFAKNALVDFYSACGSLVDARKSFEAIPAGDVISWNSVVAVYAEGGLFPDAVLLFTRMHLWGKRPSVRSFLGFLNWSTGTKDLQLGKQIHCCVMKLGLDHRTAHVQSAIINMYGKCGEIESSISVFDTVPERTLECYNSLMTSLFHCYAFEDVVELFRVIVDEGIGFDDVTLMLTLKSLSASASMKFTTCSLLHCIVMKTGFESDFMVSSALIDSYSKSGHLELSRLVFQKLPSPNVICFTSIINGYSRNGMGREALNLLEDMMQKGVEPDEVTFLCVLTGCNHSGLVPEGKLVFHSMKTLYGVDPGRQHYSCMVDMLSRAGLLDEAEELLQQAPFKDDCVMWSSLLRSCRVYLDMKVGRRAAKILMELEPEDPAVYLQASSFFSDIGDFKASIRAREMMRRKATREIGSSYI